MMQDMYFLLLSKLNYAYTAVVYFLFMTKLHHILGCIVACKAVSGAPFITNRPQSLFSNAQNFHMIFLGGSGFAFFFAGLLSTSVAQPTITNSQTFFFANLKTTLAFDVRFVKVTIDCRSLVWQWHFYPKITGSLKDSCLLYL